MLGHLKAPHDSGYADAIVTRIIARRFDWFSTYSIWDGVIFCGQSKYRCNDTSCERVWVRSEASRMRNFVWMN